MPSPAMEKGSIRTMKWGLSSCDTPRSRDHASGGSSGEGSSSLMTRRGAMLTPGRWPTVRATARCCSISFAAPMTPAPEQPSTMAPGKRSPRIRGTTSAASL